MVSPSTGKKPQVAPYSGDMLATVARSATVRLSAPGPKYSTKRLTTPICAQEFGDGEHQVGGGGLRSQLAGEADPHHLRHQHEVGLPQHDRLGLDAAHPPAQHAQAVDHGGVGVGADDRVGVGPREGGGRGAAVCRGRGAGGRRSRAGGAVLSDYLSKVFQVHLVADARSRRDHPQVGELALGPTQQRVALAVALHLDVHVEVAGVGNARR